MVAQIKYFFFRFFSLFKKDVRVVVKNIDDPIFKDELSSFLLAFKDNNGGTLEKLLLFRDINGSLSEQITNGLKDLK